MLPELDPYCTDPAQHIIAADWGLYLSADGLSVHDTSARSV